MSSIPSTDPIQSFATALAQRLDTNRDGRLSIDEFTSFLSRLLGGGALNSAATSPSTTPARTRTEQRFEGFNFEREQNIQKSAKDAFLHLARASGEMPSSKEEAEVWFNTHIRPEMDRLGHQIEWVRGDTFKFSNWQGTFVVDFVRGANIGGEALTWQAESA